MRPTSTASAYIDGFETFLNTKIPIIFTTNEIANSLMNLLDSTSGSVAEASM